MEEAVIKTEGVLVVQNKSVLLIEHMGDSNFAPGKYGLPGGQVRREETEKQTALRKLKEETGLQVEEDDLQELPSVWSASLETRTGVKKFSMKVFVCTKFQGELTESSSSMPQWVDVADLDKFDLLPNVGAAVEESLKIYARTSWGWDNR